MFPAGDEIGRQIRVAGPDRRDVEVIGVVADAPYVKLDDPTPLAAFAAALTVLLACMGVDGMLAYSVTARKREIGVRVALGATRLTVVRMIVCAEGTSTCSTLRAPNHASGGSHVSQLPVGLGRTAWRFVSWRDGTNPPWRAPFRAVR